MAARVALEVGRPVGRRDGTATAQLDLLVLLPTGSLPVVGGLHEAGAREQPHVERLGLVGEPRRLVHRVADDRVLQPARRAHLPGPDRAAGDADAHVDSIPTGLARLVELGRALATDPKVLLLDEPSSGLDESETDAFGDLLLRLAERGLAVLLVEHDVELVMRVCSQIYVLDFGEIIASGPSDDIRRSAAVQAAYLGSPVAAHGNGNGSQA